LHHLKRHPILIEVSQRKQKTAKDKYCRNCGHHLEAEENYCRQCGTQIGEDSLDQERIQKKVSSKKKTVRVLIYVAAVPVAIFTVILLARLFLPDVFPLRVTLGNEQIVLATPGGDQGEEEPVESAPEVASSENEIGGQDEDEIPSTSKNTVRVFIYCANYGKSPVEASQDDEIIVYDGWGAENEDLLEDYINNVIRDIRFDGKKIEYDTMSEISPYYDDQGNFEGYNVFFEKNIGKLSPGTHIVEGVVSWKQKIYDGWDYFGPGTDNETGEGFCEIIVN
jgi:hypothetical protein